MPAFWKPCSNSYSVASLWRADITWQASIVRGRQRGLSVRCVYSCGYLFHSSARMTKQVLPMEADAYPGLGSLNGLRQSDCAWSFALCHRVLEADRQSYCAAVPGVADVQHPVPSFAHRISRRLPSLFYRTFFAFYGMSRARGKWFVNSPTDPC